MTLTLHTWLFPAAILALAAVPAGMVCVPVDKLIEIISIDRREISSVIDADPAGCTYSIKNVDGPCAEIARAMIASHKEG